MKTYFFAAMFLLACGPKTTTANVVNFPANATLVALPQPVFTDSSPNKGGTVQVSFSAETLGKTGLPYSPALSGDPWFVDGWNASIDEFLVVIGTVALSEQPTKDQIWADTGNTVATKQGPYVVDGQKVSLLAGVQSPERADPMFIFKTKDDGGAFDASQRYAFSYDTAAATYPAWNVNLTPQGQSDYSLMVQNHWDKLLRGHMLFASPPQASSAPEWFNPTIASDFAAFSGATSVNFALGWNDATTNSNCIDYLLSNDEGDLASRGIPIFPNQASAAQITVHVDHLFWDELKQEGAPLRFDPVAAFFNQSNAQWTDSQGTFWLNNWSAQSLTATFADGLTPLPDRGLLFTNDSQNVSGANGNAYTPDQAGDGSQVQMNTNGVPAELFNDDYKQFMVFSAQSQMHLNGQGLCYIAGQNATDPFFQPNVEPLQTLP